MKRRGFALLSAILIGAFLLAAVAGIGATLTSQVRSQAQAGISKRAFYYAEAALQESFAAACNRDDNTGIRAKLLAELPWPGGPAQVSGNVGDVRAFTWVKAKPVFASGNLLRYEFIAEAVVCDRDVTGLSSSQLVAGTAFNVLARRVIKLEASGLSPRDAGSAFDFGMFAGTGVLQTGNSTYSAPEGPVAIYAGTDVQMHNTDFGAGIDVYAHDTVTIPPGSPQYPHARQLVVPPIDLAYWQSQFVAFLNGTAPYDGTVPSGGTVLQYMNTSSALVRAAISSYLKGKAVANGIGYNGYVYTTPKEVTDLCAALAPATKPEGEPWGVVTEDEYQQLKDTLSRTVFYVQDSAGSPDATILDRSYSGVLVCPGTLEFDAKREIDSTAAVFMSKGDLLFTGDGAYDTVQGTFYTDGSVTFHGSLKHFWGSIIACKDDIDLTGAGKDTHLVNYAAGNTELEDHFQALETIGSGWSEADYDAFRVF